jgi:molecular chaperone DnaK
MEGEDAEEIKQKSEALTQVSHKIAEAMYQQAAQDGAQAEPGAEAGPDAAGAQPADDDVVDADFEEVKDDK